MVAVYRYDLAVVGSGSAAFAAAITASRLGRTVLMVERAQVGGTCVNVGCVPSKALLAAASARHSALRQRFAGVPTSAGPVDFAALVAEQRALVDTMRERRYVDVAADFGWRIVPGTARFAPGPILEVTGDQCAGDCVVEAEHYLIATGAAPVVPPIPGLADAGYLTSTTALELDAVPAELLVIGGNAVGLEQAQLFARLGARVTVVEALDRLAPFDEPEASTAIAEAFAAEGIEVHTGTAVTAVHRDRGALTAQLRHRDGGERELTVSHVLVATGRRPVTADLGLDTVGVRVGARGEVVVDEHLRTGNPRIWAAGDAAGHPQFVYVAARAGAVAADNAVAGAGRVLDLAGLPSVTFTSPAIASVGRTEAAAVADGIECDCQVLSLEYVPRATVERDTRGLVKIVAERRTGRVLGVTAVAEGAGEMIAAATYAVAAGTTVDRLADAWCPYLTMTEGLRLTAQAFSRDVSTLSCCVA